MVINIPGGRQSKLDDQMIRRAALEQNIPLITTISGAFLMVNGMGEIQKSPLSLYSFPRTGNGSWKSIT
jgi:carbamoyl-phosphate synthase large subunit